MHSIVENPVVQSHPQGTIQLLFEKDDHSLSISENTSKKTEALDTTLIKSMIHFYFCIEGSAVFAFGPHYSREITKHKNYFFYNPEKNLSCQIQLAPSSRMAMMTISLEGMHKLFVNDSLPFLKGEGINQKFYDEREIPPHLLLVLNQLFTTQLSESASRLFYQGKAYEILSLYFSERKPNTESCPFLNDQETVRKIKHAKEHLLKNQEAPPSLKELAKFAGLNEYQLKAGFKEIYGNSVFGYLLDHKLDHARVLLDTQKHKVNEVAYQLGYTNPSHFIAAFKKKFGMTPKKYLMGKN